MKSLTLCLLLITIIATSEARSQLVDRTAEGPTRSQLVDRTGKDFALFFATDTYTGEKDRGGAWMDLDTPIADAEKVAEKLREDYGFETRIVENPTKQELVNTIIFDYQDKFIDESGREFAYKEGSQLLIYFAGHGHYSEKGKAGYLVTRDSDGPGIDPGQFSALRQDELRGYIDSIECKRVLVMMDTCFSGMFDPGFQLRGYPEALRDVIENGTLSQIIERKLKLPTRWTFTSASNEYVADHDGKGGHSPFATAFIEALDSRGGEDKLLRLEEIWKKIQESRSHPFYAVIAADFERLYNKEFKLPEPRQAHFGDNLDLHEGSDFLLFPMPGKR